MGIDEACIITHKAKPTIYTLARKGIIPAYKRGKKLYFYEDELLKWIEEGRKVISTKSYDEMLASMQSTVRNKPKNYAQVKKEMEALALYMDYMELGATEGYERLFSSCLIFPEYSGGE